MQIQSGKVYLNGNLVKIQISKCQRDSHWIGYEVATGKYMGIFSRDGTNFNGNVMENLVLEA